MEHLILVKRWENHINIYATVVEEVSIYPAKPFDNISNGMYDLILHLA